MKESYTTVKSEATAEIVEKHSRFIANVKPVSTEDEALDFINNLRRKYWNATHNVYAYILEENQIQRYSDDGEPSGTAGVPVLEVIRKEGITNCVAVVTRYFGGTLLGAGGLVRAYSKSAKSGIDAAQKLELILCKQLLISCDYTLIGKIQYTINSLDCFTDNINYGENVTLSVFIPVNTVEKFKKEVVEASFGRAAITESDTKYFAK